MPGLLFPLPGRWRNIIAVVGRTSLGLVTYCLTLPIPLLPALWIVEGIVLGWLCRSYLIRELESRP